MLSRICLTVQIQCSIETRSSSQEVIVGKITTIVVKTSEQFNSQNAKNYHDYIMHVTSCHSFMHWRCWCSNIVGLGNKLSPGLDIVFDCCMVVAVKTKAYLDCPLLQKLTSSSKISSRNVEFHLDLRVRTVQDFDVFPCKSIVNRDYKFIEHPDRVRFEDMSHHVNPDK